MLQLLCSVQAAAIDAQHRLLLEGCSEVLACTAISRHALHDQGTVALEVGVSIGISYNEYFLNSSHQGITAYSATSGTLSAACGRVSFSLALKVRQSRRISISPSPSRGRKLCPSSAAMLSGT
jgi:acyl transferase domain-containing protein